MAPELLFVPRYFSALHGRNVAHSFSLHEHKLTVATFAKGSCESEPEHRSRTCAPICGRLSAQTPADIEPDAVAAGPGSFAGVRVGLTTVKAWSEVYGRPIAAVSRLEALAAESTGSAPYVAAFVDARRNQIFAAMYRREGSELLPLDEEMVIAPDKFLEFCMARSGSDKTDWVSTDPECLTQTPEWSARAATSTDSVQKVALLLAPRIGQLGYRLAQQGRLTD